MQAERHQQCARCCIRLWLLPVQTHSPELGKRDRGPLGHPSEGNRCRRCVVALHEGHLPVSNLRELVLLVVTCGLRLADIPLGLVVWVEGHIFGGGQVQRVSLQPEGLCGFLYRRLPADDLRNPGSRMLAVGALLAEVGLPEPVEQRLGKPGHQRPAGSCGRVEDGLPKFRLEEILAIDLGVPKVCVCIAVGELEARQALGKMGWEAAELGEVEPELRYSDGFAMLAQGIFQPVGLRRHIVDHDDGRGFRVARGPPSAIHLVPPTFVDRRLDRSASARKRLQFRVDPYPVVERVVCASGAQCAGCDLVSHWHLLPPLRASAIACNSPHQNTPLAICPASQNAPASGSSSPPPQRTQGCAVLRPWPGAVGARDVPPERAPASIRKAVRRRGRWRS